MDAPDPPRVHPTPSKPRTITDDRASDFPITFGYIVRLHHPNVLQPGDYFAFSFPQVVVSLPEGAIAAPPMASISRLISSSVRIRL